MPLSLDHRAATRTDPQAWDFELGLPGFKYSDLNRVRRLEAIDRIFLEELRAADPGLAGELLAYRQAKGENLPPKAVSSLVVGVAPHVGRFVAKLFRVEREAEALRERARDEERLYAWKRKVLLPKVLRKAPPPEEVARWDIAALERAYDAVADEVGVDAAARAADPEWALARTGMALVDRGGEGPKPGTPPPNPEAAERLAVVERWCQALAWHPEAKKRARGWPSMKQPHPLDFEALVRTERPLAELPMVREGPPEHRRARDGFRLTDPRMTPRQVAGEVHYCLYCHEREKDSCSHGLREKDGRAKKNPLGIPLEGCPLDEKISEAHTLRRAGEAIGALAVIMIDNPTCPGTGHRICNDCMKACIFQKQDPVDIPQAETGILTDVLRLPYGVEIYGLLTRWNPLHPRRWTPRRYTGKNVLVVGMGPAGYTLAHHLLQEGFGVVGIDGLKVEPLPTEIVGARRRVPRPIKDYAEIRSRLDERIILGFGGVSEYGITVRWDKSFLDLLYLTLLRRKKFRLFGGVRFGGTLTVEDAWTLGFDHIAIAAGAGRPTIVPMKNNLCRGVRQASDFLMTLQLSGAYKANGLANLQVQLPAVVIGGGLTAIDTATECMAYYVVQCEKTLDRFERLAARLGSEDAIFSKMWGDDATVLREWLEHGRAIRAEREKAAREDRAPDLAGLVRSWGGVTICYRKRLEDSPAYRLNHEEVVKALEEGIRFAECLSPLEVEMDAEGRAQAIVFDRQAQKDGKWRSSGETVRFPARTVLIAAGTSPNAVYEKEHPGTFALDPRTHGFQGHRAERAPDGTIRLTPVDATAGEVGFFTSYLKDGRTVTFYGDNHPIYEGNVVKAMASAKHGHREVVRLFEAEIAAQDDADQPEREEKWVRFAEVLDDTLRARVVDVVRLTPTIVEVIVRAPLAAKRFQPGQFYRLQNYEVFAKEVDGFRLTMEGIALTGAWVDKERGLLSMIALETGHSSRLCALLEPGEKVIVMGPTGAPTEIPEGETVCLAGGGLGNAVLFSIAEALKAKGNRVIYFAGYKKPGDVFKRAEIERATDVVVWSVDRGPAIPARRPQDKSFVGNIVQAMAAYGAGELGETPIKLSEVDRIISIGSDRMMDAVRVARKDKLACYLKPNHVAIGSINSPMQCMMKEICAQCLQKHVDPETGKEAGIVFSCFNQDQPLDRVDFTHLRQRLSQNTAAERLTDLWLDYLFEQRRVAKAGVESA